MSFTPIYVYLDTDSLTSDSKKDVEVFCVALVTYKLTIIYEINDPSAKYVNVRERFDILPLFFSFRLCIILLHTFGYLSLYFSLSPFQFSLTLPFYC